MPNKTLINYTDLLKTIIVKLKQITIACKYDWICLKLCIKLEDSLWISLKYSKWSGSIKSISLIIKKTGWYKKICRLLIWKN